MYAPPPPRLAFLLQKDRVQDVEAIDENDSPLLLRKHGVDHGFDFAPAGPNSLEFFEFFELLTSLEVLGLPVIFGICAVVVVVVHRVVSRLFKSSSRRVAESRPAFTDAPIAPPAAPAYTLPSHPPRVVCWTQRSMPIRSPGSPARSPPNSKAAQPSPKARVARSVMANSAIPACRASSLGPAVGMASCSRDRSFHGGGPKASGAISRRRL